MIYAAFPVAGVELSSMGWSYKQTRGRHSTAFLLHGTIKPMFKMTNTQCLAEMSDSRGVSLLTGALWWSHIEKGH